MTSPQDLLYLLSFNDYTLGRQVAGISHEESLLQPPAGGNCLNWVLGHIVEARNYMLELLGEERVWSERKCAPYATRSAPITGSADVHYPWEEITRAADLSLQRVRAKLETMTAADLAENDLGRQMLRMAWHEAYHAGQTELLRRLAGKEDRAL